MSSIKLKHSGGNSMSIAAPSSNPAADRTITLNDNYGGDGSFVTANSSGNVGIGNTDPTSSFSNADDLVIGNGSGHRGMTILAGTSSISGIEFSDGTGSDAAKTAGGIRYDHSGNYMRFNTNDGSERMRIDPSGRLLVGTTTNTIGSSGATIVTNFAGNSDNGIKTRDSASHSSVNHMVMISGSTDIGQIVGTTSSVSYNSASDYRLKENVVAISDGISRLKTLKPSRFNFIIDPDKTVDGFLAHEVTAVPEAVSGTKDAVDSDGKPIHQSMDSAKLVPLLTAALQEAIAKIEVLETKVAALEAG